MKRSVIEIKAHLERLNLKPVQNYRLINKYKRKLRDIISVKVVDAT